MNRYKRNGYTWHGWFARRELQGQQTTVVGYYNPLRRPSPPNIEEWQELWLKCLRAREKRSWIAADSKGLIDLEAEYQQSLYRLRNYCETHRRTRTAHNP